VDLCRRISQAELDGFGIPQRKVEGGGDSRRRLGTTRAYRPNKLRTPFLVDDNDRKSGTDRHDGFRLVGRMVAVCQGSDECRRHEIDSLDVETRLLDGVDDAVDEIPMRCGDKDTSGDGTVFGRLVTQQLCRENRLVERERDDLLRLESHGTLDLSVGNPGHIELARNDPETGDANHDGIRDESTIVPKPTYGISHSRDVLDLTVDYRTRWEPNLTESDQLWLTRTEFELGGAYCTGPYVKSYDLLHPTLPVRTWLHSAAVDRG
jgi:hypothetical protein